ncbi:hypothetical protein NMG60_11003780 [Bertholletia excelsa]
MEAKLTPAKVQHVTKASSDQLLSKFAQVGSESEAKKELRLAKRRRRRILKEIQDNDDSAAFVEGKSLLPPAVVAKRRSSALIRRLGIGRSRLRTRDFKNRSILGTIEKTWRLTVEGASKVFLEKHYNRHRRLIEDVA